MSCWLNNSLQHGVAFCSFRIAFIFLLTCDLLLVAAVQVQLTSSAAAHPLSSMESARCEKLLNELKGDASKRKKLFFFFSVLPMHVLTTMSLKEQACFLGEHSDEIDVWTFLDTTPPSA